MCDFPRQDQFLLEALHDAGVAGQVSPDHLYGHQSVQFAVSCFVDRAHAAFAQHLQDLVTIREDTSNFEGYAWIRVGRSAPSAAPSPIDARGGVEHRLVLGAWRGDYSRVLRAERGAARGAVRGPRRAALMALETLRCPRRYFHGFSLAASERPAKMQTVWKTNRRTCSESSGTRTRADSMKWEA